MKEEVKQYDGSKEYYTAELCHINELANSEDHEELSIAKARVAPGITTRWHKLDGITERYVIIEGDATVEVGDIQKRVGPYDVVVIPPNCRQRITNHGKKDLVFLAICSPRFIVNAYMDMEDEH